MKSKPKEACQIQLDIASKSLISTLAGKNGMLRKQARHTLAALGEPVVPRLIDALKSKNHLLRWEAAKTLGEIGSVKAAPALVAALEDKDFGVRWLAAEGLIALGKDGLNPLAKALLETPDASWLREGAHHVLRILENKGLYKLVSPLVSALESYSPETDIAPQANALLKALKTQA